MKQLVICAALLPLLLAFAMQFMLMEERYAALARSEGAVRTAATIASYEGGFSEANEAQLRMEIASAFNIGADGVKMELDRELGENGETVTYDIRVSTGKILAAPLIFGVSPKDNAGVLEIRGAAPNLLHFARAAQEEEGMTQAEAAQAAT